MTTIYLVRHAEAEGNLCRRIHGQFDTNVTPNGMSQIADLALRFQQIPVDVCYSSDLTRTRTTAQAICMPHGLTVQPEPAFREVAIGVWEDQPFGYLYQFEEEGIREFSHHPKTWIAKGGESFEMYTGRFIRAMDRIVQLHDGQTVAIVSHGAVIRGVLQVLFPALEVGHSDNTAVTCLTWENGGYRLEFLNDNSHLRSGTSTFSRQQWWKKENARDDSALWFRQEPEKDADSFQAMLGETAVGRICFSCSDTQGRIDWVELHPEYRGRCFAVQLLGEAIFGSRAKGAACLWIEIPDHAASLKTACEKLGFVRQDAGRWCKDLKVRVIKLT